MVDFGINEMLAMQKELQDKYKDKWEQISPETGKNKLLWMIGEIGEVIDIIKNQFTLDNGRVVDDPVGALSSTVTVTGQVVLADKSYVRQLTSIFKKANIEIDGIIPNVLAQRSLILDINELFIVLFFSSPLYVVSIISVSLSINDFNASAYCFFSLSASSSDM